VNASTVKHFVALLVALTLSVVPAAAQDATFQVFAGRTAPASQDASSLSRTYQSGVTFGLGGGISLTHSLSLEGAATYQRFNLRSPSAILENNGMDGTGATYDEAGFYNRLGLEVNLQYTVRPSAALQPYVLAGVTQQYDYADGLAVSNELHQMETNGVRELALGVQAGGGVQAYVSHRVRFFGEVLYQSTADGTHTLPIRGGLVVQLY
jgi:outer membrane autotransporter protein